MRVPGGFATTAGAYRRYLADNDLTDAIAERVERIRAGGDLSVEAGAIRELILGAEFPMRPPRRSGSPTGSWQRGWTEPTPMSRSAAARPPRTCPRRASQVSRRPT
ncbi:MAG: hypothetical protein M5U19_06615 [Microthrixaceae bacterium]|nr:hypothetical protein [Microthrixaceae bacterium]